MGRYLGLVGLLSLLIGGVGVAQLGVRLRRELAGTGVRTLVVAPYYIDTGMFSGVTTKFPRLLPILETSGLTAGSDFR